MSEQVITRESVCEDSREETIFIFNIKKKNLSREKYVAQKFWAEKKNKQR